MMLMVWFSVAQAAPHACPATPTHIVGACGGCRPLFTEVADAGHEMTDKLQEEVERCVRSVLGQDGRPWVEGARACVRESKAIPEPLADWLVEWLDASGRGDATQRGVDDRRWSQCSVQIRHMDSRPGLCVSPNAVTLDASKQKGRTKVAMTLGVPNRCVRPVECAVTVSARRDAPATDGATGIQEVLLEPSSTTVVPFTLRFPTRASSEIDSWSVSSLRCGYPDQPSTPVLVEEPPETETPAATADADDA